MDAPPLVVGAGSIGLLVTHLLEPQGPVELVARGPTLAALRRGGFTVLAGDTREVRHPRPFSWRDLPRDGGPRTVILAVKAIDLDAALRALVPFRRRLDALFLLQNGLGILERADTLLPGIPKVRMACYTGVTRETRTRIRVHGRGPFALAAGPGAEAAASRLEAWLAGSGFPVERAASPARLEWEKAAMNLVVNGVATAAGTLNGAVLEDPALSRQAHAVLAECREAARARGIDTRTPTDAQVMAAIARVAGNQNSMLQDLRAGRPTEVGFLHGTIVRWADAAGLAIPVTRALYRRLLALGAEAGRPRGGGLRAGAGSGPRPRSRSRRRR